METYHKVISPRGNYYSTGHSTQKVTEIIDVAKKKDVTWPLEDEMTDKRMEEFSYPEKNDPSG